MTNKISIEPFRGDFEGLQAMAHSSWRDEYGIESFPDFYRPAFLRYLYDRIQDKRHFFGAYRGDEIIGFLANLPQNFFYRKNKFRAVYSCLLVVRKEWLRRGLGTNIINEAIELNKELNYDFSLYGLESGHGSTHLIKKFIESGNPVEVVKTFRVIARIVDFEKAVASEGLKYWEKAAIKGIRGHRLPQKNELFQNRLREYKPEDVGSCLKLLNRYKDMVTLAMTWEPEELSIELDYPDVSQTLVYEHDGQVKGLINFILYDHLARTKERWAWINHVAYPELTPKERVGFVRAFLHYIKEKGFLGSIEWTKNYYPMRPLYRSGFFPYFRSVRLVSWIFNPAVSLKNVRDVYALQI